MSPRTSGSVHELHMSCRRALVAHGCQCAARATQAALNCPSAHEGRFTARAYGARALPLGVATRKNKSLRRGAPLLATSRRQGCREQLRSPHFALLPHVPQGPAAKRWMSWRLHELAPRSPLATSKPEHQARIPGVGWHGRCIFWFAQRCKICVGAALLAGDDACRRPPVWRAVVRPARSFFGIGK